MSSAELMLLVSAAAEGLNGFGLFRGTAPNTYSTGDFYSKNFIGPVQWEYFYCGDATYRMEFISSMTQLKGTQITNNLLGTISSPELEDFYARH